MAQINPTTWYVRDNSPTSTIGWSLVTPWAASTAVTVGLLRRQLAAQTAGHERVFVCVVAGTTGATEPTWVLTYGSITTDGTVTWAECTGQPSVNGDLPNTPFWATIANQTLPTGLILKGSAADYYYDVTTTGYSGSSEPAWNKTIGATTTDGTAIWTCIASTSTYAAWDAPYARLQPALLNNTLNNATATWYVASDHSETWSSTMDGSYNTGNMPYGNVNVISVSPTTIPPTTFATGATFATTGASNINFATSQGFSVYMSGLRFLCGTGTTATTMGFGIGYNGGRWTCDDCLFQNGSLAMSFYAITFPANFTGNRCQIELAYGNTQILTNSANVFRDCNPLYTAASQVHVNGFYNASLIFENCDLSSKGNNPIFGADILGDGTLLNCKIASNAVVSVGFNGGYSQVSVINTDSTGTNYTASYLADAGSCTQDIVIVRTNGFAIDTTPLSQKVITNATYASFVQPFAMPRFITSNTATGSKTISVYGVSNAATIPDNGTIWMEVSYAGTTGSTMFTTLSTAKANMLAAGTALTADTTATWNSNVPVRVNSTAYAQGDSISVAGSTLVFFCTTSGTTASAAPAGYTSATDGSSITDGSAVFQAGIRFVLQATVTIALSAPIYVTIKCCAPNSTFWVDPLIVVS